MQNSLTDERRTAIRKSFAQQGLLKGLGARLRDISPGRCVIELPFGEVVTQQQGFFHGGAIGALADTAGGYAAMTMAPEGSEVLTLEYKINFLRPAAGEAVIATGEILRAGRSIIVTRIDVHVRRGDELILCAAAQQSIVPASQS
ncbi:putative esterase [compost metagenome]